jgi:hypothetical protein
MANNGRNPADHRQCVPDTPENSTEHQRPDRSTNAQAEHPCCYRDGGENERPPQVVSDEKSRRDIRAQASETECAGNRAKCKVANGPIACNLWQ